MFRYCLRVSILIVLPFLLTPMILAQGSSNSTSSSSVVQAPATVHGTVMDPTGAIIPGASIILSGNGKNLKTTSNGTGGYNFRSVPPGDYTVTSTIEGFSPYEMPNLAITPGQNKTLNISLTLAVQQQHVQVSAETNQISTSPESNANAVVLKGKALDALSDDPDELSSELLALAGPSAGPNGAQIYVDGFSGGQIPPKEDIREIRINQNPFSAKFDRLGYGRIEILTKPGTGHIHGHIFARGNDSAFNAQNPILNLNHQPGTPLLTEPSYYSYDIFGNIGGPITDHSSYFFNVFNRQNKYVSIISATDPASLTPTNQIGTPMNQAINNPSYRLDISPRLDFQFGQSNTLTARYSYYRSSNTNNGIGGFSLPEQGYDNTHQDNTLQLSDDIVMGSHFVDSLRFQLRRIRNSETPHSTIPQLNVQGAFVDGGNGSQTSRVNMESYEFQDYFTGSLGKHSLNFGARLRAYHDADYTNGGTNGAYTFNSAADYAVRSTTGTAQQYQVTVVNNNQYTARATPFDAALFYQDDWAVNPRFTFSYGLRWETQNEISDKSDWAPRIYLAYALGHNKHGRPKNVLRAGYGWFYERFTVPNGYGGTPYIIDTIHHNLPPNPSTPSNQQIYIITNPSYAETSPGNPIKPPNPTPGTPGPAPTYYTIAPNMHAAVDEQAAIGLDHQIANSVTSNVTYLYSRGVHQFLTNNISAPFFSSASNTYPATPLAPPTENIYQFESGGVYREHQIIATINARLKYVNLFSFYTYSNAKGDTDGAHSFPTNAHDPGQDYGRSGFDIQNRFLILANVTAPYQVSISPFLVYQSGQPYNIRTGSDLTANNQFNARPTFANPANGCPSSTTMRPFGKYCLNGNPIGTDEQIIPHNFGTGPSNYSVNLRISKTIGFGARLKGHGGGGGHHGGRGSVQGRGLSGNSGPHWFGPSVPHKYTMTFTAYASNLLNHQNLSPPNGTLSSSFFGKSQSLAGGFFGPSTAGNRSIFLQTSFNF